MKVTRMINFKKLLQNISSFVNRMKNSVVF
jgi:hypothetical protein